MVSSQQSQSVALSRPASAGGWRRRAARPSRPRFGPWLLLLWSVAALLAIPSPARADDVPEAFSSNEARQCLACHARPGLVAVYADGERRAVTVGIDAFKDSAHRFLPCTGCHITQLANHHKRANSITRHEVAHEVAAACKKCHPAAQLQAKAIHRQALAVSDAVLCSDCHGSHGVLRIWRMKGALSVSAYCLTCHRNNLSVPNDRDFDSLSVAEWTLRNSVHSSHACTDCHTSMSKDEHPTFRSRRELVVAVADACSGCHADKRQAYQGSIHARLVASHNARAPVCADCHGSHAVGAGALLQSMRGLPCKKCHPKVFATYEDSVHGVSWNAGKRSAPLCASCHFAHEIKPALISRSTRLACLACHTRALQTHAAWLPNTQGHFDAVTCVACHVVDATPAVYLQFADSSGEAMDETRLRQLLGSSFDDLLQSGSDNTLGGPQLWALYKMLNRGGDKPSGLTGTIGLRDGLQAHRLSPRGTALRQCDRCHHAGSAYFATVFLAVPRNDGTRQLRVVSPQVLQSVFSTLPLRQFYAPGSTRMGLLDTAGLLLVLCSVAAAVAHIALRAVSRLRARRGASVSANRSKESP
jgi:hypothetical protein